jgi:hypothetical protein
MPMWIIPKDEIIYVKETLGPHNIYESSLNPLEIFFQLFKRILSDQYSGTKLTTKVIEMMQSKICLIIMGRQPVEAWSSNLATYTKLIRSGNLKDNPYYSSSEEELLKNFIAAYQWVNKIRKIAIDLSIPLHHYMYEANQYAETSIPALFKKLQIKQLPKINGWTDQSVVGNKNSNVFIISDFTNQKKANLHDTLDNSNGIQYFPRNIDQVSDQIKQIIQKSGLHEIYNQWKNETEKELEITLSKKVNR